MYWEKNKLPEDNVYTGDISVELEELDASTVRLVIRTDESVNGVADVFVDWTVKKNGGMGSLLLFNPMLYVQNTGSVYANYQYFDSNWLRAENAEYIPVTVTDGYGEAVLTSVPERDTSLDINDVSCNRILPVQFDYLHVSDVGVSIEGNAVLSAVNTMRNSKIAEEICSIEIAGERFEVLGVEKGTMLRLEIDSQNVELLRSYLKKGNMVFCEKGALR